MTKYLLILLLSLSYLQATCKEYTLLGSENQNQTQINSKDSIVWDKQDNVWSVSKPKNSVNLTSSTCKESGYVLVSNSNMAYKTLLHHTNYYDLKEGWNYLTAPKDGVDVTKTFMDAEFVYVYDKRSSAWAGYSPKKELMSKIKSTRILELRYIEPKRGFYVLSQKAMRVAIASKLPNAQCQKFMQNSNFDVIYDSGIDKAFSFNGIKSAAVASRYFSHTRKGVYNDSRVAIMVPKLKKLSTNKIAKKYAPAVPKIMIHFNEAYADKKFYAYDYLNESCHKGYFPSKRKPPAPTMETVK